MSQPAKGDTTAAGQAARASPEQAGSARSPAGALDEGAAGKTSDARRRADPRLHSHPPHHAGSARILNQGHSSLRARFLQPVVVKQGNVFLLCSRDGNVAPGSEQGLYFHDMRYLDSEVLTLDGQPLQPLLANAADGHRAIFELSNPDLPGDGQPLRVRKETLGIRREQRLGDAYVEVISIRNHATETAEFEVALAYSADFVDMFEVRGTAPGRRGTLQEPSWRGRSLRFRYDGADRHRRRLDLGFSRSPDERGASEARFLIRLKSQQTWELTITGELRDEDGQGLELRPSAQEGPGAEQLHRSRQGAMGEGMALQTSNPLFNEVLARSLQDLHMLSMRLAGQPFFAAGVPWYVALFGRDSLLTAIQMAAFEPDIAEHTLRVLASRQGTRVDDDRDEQPGRILHELRSGEMANLGEVPQTPYFGSVDATPLFLVLLGIHASWTGRLDLFDELRSSVDAALAWIERDGDSDGDGFVDYRTRSRHGLRNQGWKDSGNAIVMEDGSLAELPIALPEVQGYVHLAWLTMAELFRRDGQEGRAAELEARAGRLRQAFDRDFWLDGQSYYAFCRDGRGRFSRSVASNPAHALWTGIVPPERAGAVVERAMRPDMFSGWGVRTLSAADASYNPIDYQVGSIWPHDNAFIALGMHQMGHAAEAAKIFDGTYQAAIEFEHYRLPEVFAGYDQAYSSVPVQYPVACSPQAWAAGSIPLLLQTALGLRPEAFEHRLRIERPTLPSWLDWVHVTGLRVGAARVDLRYERSREASLVAVERIEGELGVRVEY